MPGKRKEENAGQRFSDCRQAEWEIRSASKRLPTGMLLRIIAALNS